MKKGLTILLGIIITAPPGCRQTYAPPAITNPPRYLVVEGFINNNSADTTVFTLSRTVPLADSSTYTAETGATVAIEDSAGNRYSLIETDQGIYSYPPYPFNNKTKYRLHIFTTGREEYTSDFIPLVSNPPIDSITWARSDDPLHLGVTIFANTHDPNNNTRYYRWACEQTWEYHVKYYTLWGLVNNIPTSLNGDTAYICWRSDNTTTIDLASSTQLAQDVIYQAPLTLIPLNSQLLQIEYSTLVKQYALTKDAFTWWQILKKNTEQIGSIFGVQPSANPGNIHCLSDTTKQVLGYVSGGNIQKQRIFITNDQVTPWTYVDDCIDSTVSPSEAAEFLNRGYLLFNIVQGPGYVISHNYCVDCTLTGTNKKPSYWQ